MTFDQTSPAGSRDSNALIARRVGVDTRREAVIFMRKDCPVCRSEGFTAHARVRVANGKSAIIATLYQVTSELLQEGEAGLSNWPGSPSPSMTATPSRSAIPGPSIR